MITISLALKSDMDAIRRLLESNNLPHSDLNVSPITFFVARTDEKVVGCIGIERYENTGLLRSFAVAPELQNRGIGKELYKNLLEYARQNQIKSLHLLTTTASEYFSRAGHQIANRSNAPEPIARSTEFAGLCPASSAYMVLDLP